MNPFKIEKLSRDHGVDGFDCGSQFLNIFLRRYALANQQANGSQTYVGHGQGAIIGFYTLAVSEVDADIAGTRTLVVHARDDAAHPFYSHFGFADGFTDPLHLYVLTKDLKLLVG